MSRFPVSELLVSLLLFTSDLLCFLFFVRKDGDGKTGTDCALDCGAGIGRISKRLLLPLFKTVDLVDVTQEFLDKAKTYLGEEGKRVGKYLCSGLQDLVPESGRYDVIWIQWVIGESATMSVIRRGGGHRVCNMHVCLCFQQVCLT